MDAKRRLLLKGITATAAVSTVAPQVVLADPIGRALVTLRETSAGDLVQKPIVAVAIESFKSSAFMQAIRTTQPAAEIILDGVDFPSLNELLTQKENNLVGIIDHANAAVLVQLSRHYNAKIHWLGQHAIYDHSTAHNIFKSGDSSSCHASLLEGLGACEASHAVREQGLHSSRISGKATAVHPQAWAGHLALALHDVGKGTANTPLVLNQPSQLISGSAVTFLIETC
jgi:hypothetical protein